MDSPTGEPQYTVGGRIGKYDITAFLGRGGMGEVYRGFDPLIERDVALKVLPAGLSSNLIALQRFLGEARAVGKLIHPHTVALYEIGQSGAAHYLAMEFVPGGSIADLVVRDGQLSWERATRFMIEVCQGLAAAHAVGLIHRDIKPENLLLTNDDHVKITDFGLAKAMDALNNPTLNLTKPGDMLGTPYYMSPEQFSGTGLDLRTDIYSAGGTYYHLLTGRRPYSDAATVMHLMYAHCNGPVPDPRVFWPELPDGCIAVLHRAMAKKPDHRYETATEMAAALTALLPSSTPTAVRKATPLTVWLVEPSRLQARVLQGLLTELGVEQVQSFATIADTMAALPQGSPTAIISAMHLDDGSGDDLTAKVRTAPNGAKVACFLVSSSGAGDQPGRSHVLPKPVTREALTTVLQKVRAG